MYSPTRVAAFALIATSSILGGSLLACSGSAGEEIESGEDAITSNKTDDHWFYGGALPTLENPSITVSLAGHTNRVSGTVPAGTTIPNLPHVKTKPEGADKIRVDVVYPIATARPGKQNSRPGDYSFYEAKPYRPNGAAFTQSDGWHQVTWGGFPFIAYNSGIAFHGPITDQDNEAPGDLNVWYLRRGAVSAGCNRMMGEHVIELANLIGIDMHKVYEPNKPYAPTTTAKVKVIPEYDKYGDKFIDVDYPTDTGATRPGKVHGNEKVVMFGSWVATEMPDGRDLPPDLKWEAGITGQLYDFQAHAQRGVVCSMPKATLAELKTVAARTSGALTSDFCAKKLACDARLGRVCKPSEI